MIRAWAVAFFWTLALELPVYAAVLARDAASLRRALGLGLLLNLVTHPLFSVWVFAVRPGPFAMALAEIVIALVEGELLGRWICNRSVGYRAALPANAFSYLAGLAMYRAGIL